MTNQCSIDNIKLKHFLMETRKRMYESKMGLAFHVDFKTGRAWRIETFLMVNKFTDTKFMERRRQRVNAGR